MSKTKGMYSFVLLALLQKRVQTQFLPTLCDVPAAELEAANQRPIQQEVRFYCAHRGRPLSDDKVSIGDPLLTQKLNLTLPLTLIIHGFTESKNLKYYIDITKHALTYQNINFCIVDWADLANVSYAVSAQQTERVGNHTADFINYLVNEGFFSLKKIKLLGVSLGAHAAGFAGARLNGALPLIVGSDPAGPCFSTVSAVNRRLRSSDAKFVQAIHTDNLLFGSDATAGHADYYANGGINPQPGCPLQGSSPTEQLFCSHQRAHDILNATMNPANEFLGYQCSSYDDYILGKCNTIPKDKFGVYSNNNVSGKLYFRTTSQYPYTPCPGIL